MDSTLGGLRWTPVFLVLLLSVPSLCQSSTDTAALLSFKSSFSNGNSVLWTWRSGTSPCNQWAGVTCNYNYQIEKIVLYGQGLVGTIPSYGWVLPTTLRVLILSSNHLAGTIPMQLGLPQNLYELALDGNRLSGTVPSTLVLPTSLEYLSLFNNNLEGSLPSWPNHPNTVVFILPGNKGLCGTVPADPQYEEFDDPVLNVTRLPSSPLPEWNTTTQLDAMPICSQASSPNTGAIVGAVVGSIVGIGLVGLGTWWYVRKKRSKKQRASAPKFPQHSSGRQQTLQMPALPTPAKRTGTAKPAAPDAAGKPASLASKPSMQRPTAPPLAQSPTTATTQMPPRAEAQLSPSPAASAFAGAAHTGAPPPTPVLTYVAGTTPPPSHERSSSSTMAASRWMLNFSDLNVQQQIGEGSYGKVFLATWRETQVAVKILSAGGIDGELLSSFQQEAELTSSLRHPNIISFYGMCLNPPCLVSEFASRGSLTAVLSAAASSPDQALLLDWPRRLEMMLDAAKGMLYLHLHDPPILHRDLKSTNLLVDRDWHVKVADFNLSRIVEGDVPVASSLAMHNPRWLAPEIMAGTSGATFASDTYAYGIVLWEALTWQLPWKDSSPYQVVIEVAAGKRPEVPGQHLLPGAGNLAGLEAYTALMHQCWSQNPADRPTFTHIISRLRSLLAAVRQPPIPSSAGDDVNKAKKILISKMVK